MDMHQGIFHILSDFGNQMNIIDKQLFKQVSTDITLISKEFSEEFLMEFPVFERFSVVNMCLGDEEFNNLSLIIDNQMKLKTEKPPDGRFAGCHSFENLM
jgi:hypothetical protein